MVNQRAELVQRIMVGVVVWHVGGVVQVEKWQDGPESVTLHELGGKGCLQDRIFQPIVHYSLFLHYPRVNGYSKEAGHFIRCHIFPCPELWPRWQVHTSLFLVSHLLSISVGLSLHICDPSPTKPVLTSILGVFKINIFGNLRVCWLKWCMNEGCRSKIVEVIAA